MFDVFDEAIIEKGEKIFKIVVIVVGLVISIVYVSGDIEESAKSFQNTKAIFDEGVTLLEEEGISLSELQSPEYYALNEQVVYTCLSYIAQEKGCENISISAIKEVLDDEEKDFVQNIVANTNLNNVDLTKLKESKPYRVEVFGVDNSTKLYDIINAHISDF